MGKSKIIAAPQRRRDAAVQGPDWNFDMLGRIFEAVREIGEGEMGLDPYRTQIEVITSEQMLDAYSSVGMPLFYQALELRQGFRSQRGAVSQGLAGSGL
jgi:spore cortex formation protein SpoVR/YcgB (stage V sporulation)